MSLQIKQLRQSRGWTQDHLASLIGVSKPHVSEMESGKKNPSMAVLDKMAAIFAVPASQLLGEAAPSTPAAATDTLLPVYNVQASAGHGALVGDEYVVSQIAFPPGYLQKLTRADPRNLAIIGVKGDSMLPSLSDDDVVMLDTSKRDLSYDGLFVLRDNGDGLLVKRIGRAGRKGYVMVISDNSNLYPPIERAMADIEVLGKVIWVGRKV